MFRGNYVFLGGEGGECHAQDAVSFVFFFFLGEGGGFIKSIFFFLY